MSIIYLNSTYFLNQYWEKEDILKTSIFNF